MTTTKTDIPQSLNIHNIRSKNNFIIYNNEYIILFPFADREYFSNVEKDDACPSYFAKERVLVLVPKFGLHEMFDAEMFIRYDVDTGYYSTCIHDLENNIMIMCNNNIEVISYDIDKKNV